MSDGRKRLSGSEYRKQAAKKKLKDDEVMGKTKKLSSYFKSKQTATGSSNTEETSEFFQKTLDSADELNDEVSSENPFEDLERRQSDFGKAVGRDREGSTESTKRTEHDGEIFTFSDDPAKWLINDSTRDYIAEHNYKQNTHLDFAQSKRIYNNAVRYLNLSLFERKLLNGEKTLRTWLVYSESKGSVYCAPCLLFDGESSFASKDGFSDWKNAVIRMSDHENSKQHQSCLKSLKDRASNFGRIDKTLIAEYNKEVAYWQNVLKRVVAVIKGLASRGLPFRGHDEKFGSLHNGNYLMVLELIAEFDPFLADHISRFGSKDVIFQEIHYAKYYSIIVDSTPNISHVDQLCLMLRYVNKDGMSVERFVTFLQNVGHKAADMDDAVISTLKTLQIDIENCRGQSASTSRWDVLQCCCKKSERIVLKSVSITRWSARNDAVHILDQYYTEILQALYSIEDDVSQKAAIRSEAKGIRNRFELLETAFMQCLWSFLLSRFNSVSKKLQSTQTNLNEVVRLYKSLIKTVGDAREDFDYFEKKAFDLSVNQEYKTEVCRVKRRKIYDDETRTGEVTLLGKDNFKVNTYNVIFDNLLADIQERCQKYETIYEKFSVLIDFMNMDIADIRGKVQILQGAFNKDLESSLDDELIHFKAYLDCDKQNLKQLTPIETFKFLKKNDLDSVFPNVDIAYRMFLCMAVTNCS
ncbi:PREDICTED: uncharacterized protein LOC108760585, partial [Trachymyrmex cornetzi]|uniref:uncharacterized protein LOC108760585 n=1 Tax=Trachymyrmex cornetzi TaxID=471704 RepID=UPI00084F6954